jgi:hypothetical protein
MELRTLCGQWSVCDPIPAAGSPTDGKLLGTAINKATISLTPAGWITSRTLEDRL